MSKRNLPEYHFWSVKDTKFKFRKDRIYLSFSQGRTDYGKMISFLTNGPCSHVDLILDGKRYTALTKTGVGKYILAENDYITVFELSKDFDKKLLLEFFEETKGHKYSFSNILDGQLLRRQGKEKDAYFCSQWVAEALDRCYTGNKTLMIKNRPLLEYGTSKINPNGLFLFIMENRKRYITDYKVTNSPWSESVSMFAYGEKYEINNGIYELYGPREKEFTDKKHIVSLCYRLMWNLKNTNRVREFDEIRDIYFDTVKGKPYAMIVLNNDKKFIFYLGNIYTPIPSEFNDKEIVVEPMEHKINVFVNTKGDSLQTDIDELRGGKNRTSWFSKPKKEEEPKTEEEELLEDEDNITPEVVEELVDENSDVTETSMNGDEQEKKRQNVIDEIKETFEDKILKGLIKKGLVREDV